MYPRHRLDGLGDAIYGVSMTLLVLDIRIPEGLSVIDNAGLIAVLRTIWPHALPYLISFLVLSSGWLSAIRVAHRSAEVGPNYVRWWRPQLLLVTLMPFSTILVARFDKAPLAVAFYAVNIGLMSLCAWRMWLTSDAQATDALSERRASLILLVALSLTAVVLSPWLGAWALLLYAVKGVPFFVQKRLRSAT